MIRLSCLLAWILTQTVPASLEVPKGNKLILHTYAKGVQIYLCAQVPTDTSKYIWVLSEPRANLYREKNYRIQVGKHYYDSLKRPTWESTDGSKITCAKVAQENVPGAIPWLLLKTVYATGFGPVRGTAYIQRLNTVGGVAPATGATVEHKGEYLSVPYTAEYLFYGQ